MRCPECGKEFTYRSFQEHQATSHLGRICLVLAHRLDIQVDDDEVMAQVLERINVQLGMRAHNRQGFDEDIIERDGMFWCYIPACDLDGHGHSYTSKRSLRRHLRTFQKQRKVAEAARRAALNGVPAVAANAQAVPDVHIADVPPAAPNAPANAPGDLNIPNAQDVAVAPGQHAQPQQQQVQAPHALMNPPAAANDDNQALVLHNPAQLAGPQQPHVVFARDVFEWRAQISEYWRELYACLRVRSETFDDFLHMAQNASLAALHIHPAFLILRESVERAGGNVARALEPVVLMLGHPHPHLREVRARVAELAATHHQRRAAFRQLFALADAREVLLRGAELRLSHHQLEAALRVAEVRANALMPPEQM